MPNFDASSATNTALVLFAYNRPQHFKECIQSLIENDEFAEFDCHIFIDGPKLKQDKSSNSVVLEVARKYAQIYPNIQIHISRENFGLRKSIRNGLDDIFKTFESAIVLEDDLIVSNNFIEYMMSQLLLYKDDKSIGSITGYKECVFPPCYRGDTILSRRQSCWGWATWKDRWMQVDWQKLEPNSQKFYSAHRKLSKIGADLGDIFKAQQIGLLDSWAIDFDRSAALLNWRSVHPRYRFVVNSGFDGSGTHFSTEMLDKKKILYNGSLLGRDQKAKFSISYDLCLRVKFSKLTRNWKRFKFKVNLLKNQSKI